MVPIEAIRMIKNHLYLKNGWGAKSYVIVSYKFIGKISVIWAEVILSGKFTKWKYSKACV
jgi:hypothetical protein